MNIEYSIGCLIFCIVMASVILLLRLVRTDDFMQRLRCRLWVRALFAVVCVVLSLLCFTAVYVLIRERQQSVVISNTKKGCGIGSAGVHLNKSADFYVKIAEVILVEIYGTRVLSQRPWNVKEDEDRVTIVGTLHVPNVKGAIVKGGTAMIVLAKSDCRVLELTHGR